MSFYPPLKARYPISSRGIHRIKAHVTNVLYHPIHTLATTNWAPSSTLFRGPMASSTRWASGIDGEQSVEDTLASLKFIDLTQDWNTYRSFETISNSASEVWSGEMRGWSRERRAFDTPVCFVHGPSGSGKTFFARNMVANKLYQREYNRTRNVTLYLCPNKANVKFVYNDERDATKKPNDKAATELFDWIKSALRRRSIEIRHKLDMHVCIIIDDVSAQDVQLCFQNWGVINELCWEAEKFAESVVVAICSTGLTRYDRIYKSGINTFRMQQWDEQDLPYVLSSFQSELGLRLEGWERTEDLAKALWEHPSLGALATNAYMAESMVRAFVRVWSIFYRNLVDSKLDEIALHVLPEVIQDYLDKYGISELSPKQQRRIAASVFRVQGKRGIDEVPTLVGLTENESVIAESFLQYNINDSDDWFKITVTPGQQLVLFAMVGIPTPLMARWNAVEQRAVFYVVRQAMLQCMERFTANTVNSKDVNTNRRLDHLDNALENIRLYRLERCVETDHQTTYRYGPIVDVGTNPINGNGAPFADIIVPYTLIQTWRRSSPLPLLVNLQKELQKCGLFKEDGNSRVLQGLLALWQLRTNSLDQGICQPDTNTSNEVSLVSPTVVEGDSGIDITVGDGTDIGLPSLDGSTITFLLSTEADAVELRLSVGYPLVKITKANLGDNMEVNIDTLTDVEKLLWTKYVSDKIRKEVRIKFLFTKQGVLRSDGS